MGHTPTHRLSGSGTDEGGGGAGGGGSQSAWDIAPPWGVVDTNDYIKGLQDGFSSGILQQIRDNFTTPISDADLQSEVDLWNEAGMDFSDVPLTVTDSQVIGRQDMKASQQDIGISSGAVGSRKELGRMLESYQGRTSLIQAAQRQKAIYTIDRFDGGLNLNKSPRDLAYWEACQMDCLTPSKVGRLIRLGDFGAQISASSANGLEGLNSEQTASIENYGLHYFKLSDSIAANESFAGETPTNYIAIQDGDDIDIWNLGNSEGVNDTTTNDLISSLSATAKPVYHNASNRVYVSDATFASSYTRMFGIVDRRKLFPFDSSGTLTYNITGDSHLFTDQLLYHAPPTKGVGSGHIMVTGTQLNETSAIGGNSIAGFSNTEGGTYPDGIYININFESISGDEASGIGWGSTNPNGHATNPGTGTKYYKFYASFLYDDGSETKLTDVTSSDNAADSSDTVKATTGESGQYQKMIIKQVLIDGAGIVAALPRVHGARFYYDEVNNSGESLGNDKYLWAELDFRYGFKLVSEFGNWNQFEDDNGTTDGSTASDTQSIQVLGAANSGTGTEADTATAAFGTLEILSPPTVFTYYSLNLFHQEEIKDDLLWATSAVGNGIAFIGNIEYDGRQYPDTMLYSGAGETDAGSAYPMWGTFPVDSNRIDIPGTAGEITALKWTSGRVLQFRKNALYVVNVEDVLAPKVEGVYQGMGVHGQYAVTETPFGVAWVNDNGVYAYSSEGSSTVVASKLASSLTIGRLDTEDFITGQSGTDADKAKTKIGYDDRAKMLIITNSTKYDTDGYHYAYSFVTDAWCTWNANKAQAANVKTNFAIDHDGYLTSGIGTTSNTTFNIYKWSVAAQAAQIVDYITKDIDFGKPSLDKRLYTVYISYTGGDGQSALNVYFRVNGKEGTDLTNGWHQLETIQDYTDPYFTTNSTAWNDSSGTPTTGNPKVNISTGLNSTSTGEVQKLAKINLRNLGITDTVDDTDTGNTTFPTNYLKFARSIQFRFTGTADENFEINDISLVYKEKRLK